MRIIILCVSLLVTTFADDDMFSVDKKSNLKYYCGHELRQVLMFICGSVYNKRSSPDGSPMHDDWVMNFIGMDEPQTVYPFRSRTKAFAVLPSYFRRQTRGVADECCSKPCTIEELSSYCGLRPK